MIAFIFLAATGSISHCPEAVTDSLNAALGEEDDSVIVCSRTRVLIDKRGHKEMIVRADLDDSELVTRILQIVRRPSDAASQPASEPASSSWKLRAAIGAGALFFPESFFSAEVRLGVEWRHLDLDLSYRLLPLIGDDGSSLHRVTLEIGYRLRLSEAWSLWFGGGGGVIIGSSGGALPLLSLGAAVTYAPLKWLEFTLSPNLEIIFADQPPLIPFPSIVARVGFVFDL